MGQEGGKKLEGRQEMRPRERAETGMWKREARLHPEPRRVRGPEGKRKRVVGKLEDQE